MHTCCICTSDFDEEVPDELDLYLSFSPSESSSLSSVICPKSPMCVSCAVQFVCHEIIEARIDHNGTIRCPCGVSCPNRITRERILHFILMDSDNYASIHLSPSQLLEKYEKFSLNSRIQADPNLVFCPAPDCGGIGHIHKHKQATCEKCQFEFCSLCQTQHSYLQFCRSTPSSVSSWKSSNHQHCRKCPKCRQNIEKNGGCDHMTCQFCRHEFCWRCKGDFHHLPRGVRVRGRCRGGKLCKLAGFNQHYLWGESPVTRVVTKGISYPVLTGLGIAMGGVGVGVIVGIGATAVAIGTVTVLPYMVLKELHSHSKHRFPYQDAMAVQPPILHPVPFGHRHSFYSSSSSDTSETSESDDSSSPRPRSHSDLVISVSYSPPIHRSNSAPSLMIPPISPPRSPRPTFTRTESIRLREVLT